MEPRRRSMFNENINSCIVPIKQITYTVACARPELIKIKDWSAIKCNGYSVCTDNPLVPFMLANKSDPATVARLCKQVTPKPMRPKFYLQRNI